MRAAFLLAIIGVIGSAMTASATEEPPHSVILDDGQFQIRSYQPAIVAEVEVTGDMRRAGNSGFRPLADFIFGNNTAQSDIEMTAPVTRQPASQKIEMTAPVTRVESADDVWTVTFFMPNEWTMETLPQPNNPEIKIREIPSEMIATIRFSGRGRERTHAEKQVLLEAWITEQGYRAVGPARYAGYNAPFVPGPLRRNEVMIPVERIDDDTDESS
ncbi:MAG: heme-binding protein [Pseudomonadota bacterium]